MMFTGLVEGVGKVKGTSRVQGEMQLTILPLFAMEDCSIGESISVNGACLTVTGLKDRTFTVDVSAETLSRTTLSRLKQDDEVNLERALRMTDRLGGHLVSGHVDGVGKILKIEQVQRSWRLEIGVDADVSRYIIEKGSIAVDGVSLTVNRCGVTAFEVNIIPQTGRQTSILKKRVGDFVNIETDLIGKYVDKLLMKGREKAPSAINHEMLKKFGFGD